MSCCICKESLNDNIKSYATGCGHVFHDPCLSKWREQQNACPQCRRNLNVEPIRLYLNLADDGNYEDCDNQGEKEDIDALKVKLESLRKEIQEKQIKYENLERKLEKNKELCVNFKERFLALQVKYDVMKRTMKEIKSEIREMKDLHGAKEELQRTLKNLEEKLLVLNGMYDLLNCTPNEADNLLKEIPVSEFGLKQLATFAAGLKYKAKEDEKKISKLMSELKEIHSFFESKTRKMLHGKSKTKRKFDCASEVQSLQNITANEKESTSPSQILPMAMQNTSHFNINLDLLKEKDMGESSKILQVSKSIKDWEDLIAAGPINHFGSSIKTTLCGVVSNSKDAKRARFDYSSGERVGEKKIWLGYPTPKEEFNKIKKVGSQTSLKLLRK